MLRLIRYSGDTFHGLRSEATKDNSEIRVFLGCLLLQRASRGLSYVPVQLRRTLVSSSDKPIVDRKPEGLTKVNPKGKSLRGVVPICGSQPSILLL